VRTQNEPCPARVSLATPPARPLDPPRSDQLGPHDPGRSPADQPTVQPIVDLPSRCLLHPRALPPRGHLIPHTAKRCKYGILYSGDPPCHPATLAGCAGGRVA
jgi:hypothetical protein